VALADRYPARGLRCRTPTLQGCAIGPAATIGRAVSAAAANSKCSGISAASICDSGFGPLADCAQQIARPLRRPQRIVAGRP
jgi:hypothetical protein